MGSASDYRARARQALGGNIFGEQWMAAFLTVLIQMLIILAIEGISKLVPFLSVAIIVVSGPLTFAVTKMFLTQARLGDKMKLEGLFDGFKGDLFGQTLLLGLLQTIFVALWSLLLVVPGIIKGYAYSMSYYIKVDHPEYDWKQCLDESQRMMKGHKMDLFLLQLSFIGWAIVGMLCLGIGVVWVEAYINAATTEFYRDLALN